MIGIFVLIKDEHLYLDDYIKYHLGIGVNHIIVVEDYESKTHKAITDKYPKDKVTLLNVFDFYNKECYEQVKREKSFFHTVQKSYLIHGMRYIKNHYNLDWCFVTDIDEYLTIDTKYKNISEALSIYKDYDAVELQWQNYGANGLIYIPDYSEKSITDIYTKLGNNANSDRYWFKELKTVYNMHTYTDDSLLSNHIANFNIKWCRSDFSQSREKKIYDNIYIRHYITKSFEEYFIKLAIRGMFYRHRTFRDFFDINPDMKHLKLDLIEKFKEKYNIKNERLF